MKSLTTLLLASAVSVSAGIGSAQTEPQVGQTFMWDGLRWVSISLQPHTLPIVSPQPVRTSPQPRAAVRQPGPSQPLPVGLRPTFLLGVYR